MKNAGKVSSSSLEAIAAVFRRELPKYKSERAFYLHVGIDRSVFVTVMTGKGSISGKSASAIRIYISRFVKPDR